jgi:hypothetical protein
MAATAPLCAQTIDFKMLDKLGEKAKESSVVNLGPDQLGMLTGITAGEGKNLGEVAKAMKSVQVRSYEFENKGDYEISIVQAFRDKVKASGEWVNIIETKERGGFTDISYEKGADGKSKGFLIIAAEPREVTVVHIDGPLDLSALGKLGGVMGIPEMVGPQKKTPPPAKAPDKEEDEEL